MSLWTFIVLLKLTGAPPEHVVAAAQAQTPDFPAIMLLRQSHRESRWKAPGWLVVSRMQGGVRRTGRLFTFTGTSGPYFCGSLQLKRLTPAACRKINRDVPGSYREAVKHLYQWRAYCQRVRHPDIQVCTLAGYGGGVKGTRTKGRAYRYAVSILREAGLR